MGSELYERLKHLKRARSGGDDESAGGPDARRDAGQGLWHPTGNAAARDVLVDGNWEPVAEGVWKCRTRTSSKDAAYLRRILEHGSSSVIPAAFDADRLVFFDAETTGLSSGAGTSAFLVGFARLTSEEIITDQLFMSDYPAEPAFLQVLTSLISEDDLLVSYNGKGFDSQVLTTRFLLNGMHIPIGAQLDLLYMARRLWKTMLPDCTLNTVERSVLDIARAQDLPSAEVPERYFQFLRSANSFLLEEVFAHHLQDIESLVSLLTHIERVFESPTDTGGVDEYQLGRMLLSQGRNEGLTLLHRVVRESGSSRQSVRAARELGRYYRRQRGWEAAAKVWQEVMERHSSVAAGVELAKYLEHKLKDFPAAEGLVVRLLAWPHSLSFRADLQRRLERIRRRHYGRDARASRETPFREGSSQAGSSRESPSRESSSQESRP